MVALRFHATFDLAPLPLDKTRKVEGGKKMTPRLSAWGRPPFLYVSVS